MTDLRYLRHKRAKGREYLYFATGQKDERGREILTPLPPKRSLEFGGAYARALAARTTRQRRHGALDFAGLVQRYERSPEYRKLAEGSRALYSRYLAAANRLLRGPRGESPPAAAIEPRDVLRIREKMADTPGAANTTIRALGALYAWASRPEQGYARGNPAARITLFDIGEHQPWPEALLEEALRDEAVRFETALLYFTGQRIGDVVKMQRSDVRAGQIRVYAQKTRSHLLIPMLDELAALVDRELRRPATATALLTNSRGRPYTVATLRAKLQKWAEGRGARVVPHGLRKNAVNALFEAGCTAAEVSAITDQSLAMLEHYGKGRSRSRLGVAAIVKLEDARKARKA